MDTPKDPAPPDGGDSTVKLPRQAPAPFPPAPRPEVPGWLSLGANLEPEEFSCQTPGAPSAESLQGKIPGVDVIEFKGEGSMGWIYKARLHPFTRVLALKLLRTDRGFGPEAQHQFEMEAKILADLEQHEGLVRCYKMDRKSNGGELYYLSDWVEGQNLAEVLKAYDPKGEKGLPLDDALDYIIQAGEALQAAHEQRVLHRDLKPSNLMLTSKGKIKVVDFGLALQSGEHGLTNAFLDGCSPSYAAPEQIGQSGGAITERTDVYGLAATLYHLITGRCPIGWCQNPSALINVGTAVDEVLRRAMSASPLDRPDMREFVASLRRLRSGGQDDGPEATVVLLNTQDLPPSQQPEALAILNVSPGVQQIPVDEPYLLAARCRTPSSGAALGLRWLQSCPEARLGLASDSQSHALAAARRLAALARPGQLLVPQRTLYSLRSQGMPGPGSTPHLGALFHVHGRYTWPAGTPGGSTVTEVVGQIHPAGTTKRDPFEPPANPIGGQPELDADAPWRAGAQLVAGTEVPHCPGWILQRRLGSGGYGEVWLAQHPKVMDVRVFKFCGDASRLAAFRNEAEILRYLARTLPDETGFASLLAEQLASAPFWLQMKYCPLGNLEQWLTGQGDRPAPALEVRLQLLSQVARLVAQAHQVGVIHRDLKLANILIERGRETGSVWPLLTDFGLSGLDDDLLVPGTEGDTPLHRTQLQLMRAGTRLYAAPESATSPKSDVYALGVILYQTVTGHLLQRPEEGWKDEVKDLLLREDIAAAIHKDPGQRLDAAALSERLRHLDQRRTGYDRRRVRRWALLATLAAAALLLIAGGLVLALRHMVHKMETSLKKQFDMAAELHNAQAQAEKDAALKTFGQAMMGLSKFVDYTQLKQEAQGYIGHIKAMAESMVRLEMHRETSGDTLDLAALTSRVEYQIGIINMFDGFGADSGSLHVEQQLAEAALRNSLRGRQLAPRDLDFLRHVMDSARAVGRARAQTGQDDPAAYAAFDQAAEAMRQLTRDQNSNQGDFLRGLEILESMAVMRESAGLLNEAATLWREVQALALEGLRIGTPSPATQDLFKRHEADALLHLRTLEKRRQARQAAE